MKNKGFTLIELLAVIVVLAVIMIIATTSVNETVKTTRAKAFSSSFKILEKDIKNKVIADELKACNSNPNDNVPDCSDYYDISSDDYDMSITDDVDGYVFTLIGKKGGKFNNMVLTDKICPLEGACFNETGISVLIDKDGNFIANTDYDNHIEIEVAGNIEVKVGNSVDLSEGIIVTYDGNVVSDTDIGITCDNSNSYVLNNNVITAYLEGNLNCKYTVKYERDNNVFKDSKNVTVKIIPWADTRKAFKDYDEPIVYRYKNPNQDHNIGYSFEHFSGVNRVASLNYQNDYVIGCFKLNNLGNGSNLSNYKKLRITYQNRNNLVNLSQNYAFKLSNGCPFENLVDSNNPEYYRQLFNDNEIKTYTKASNDEQVWGTYDISLAGVNSTNDYYLIAFLRHDGASTNVVHYSPQLTLLMTYFENN